MRKTLGKGNRPTRADIRKAAKAVVEGVPVRHAMRQIGYSDSTADKAQRVLVDNPVFKEETGMIRAALLRKEAKIFDKVASTMIAGLDATETKFFAHEGEVQEAKEVTAWSERRQMAELIARVFGEFYQKEDESKKGDFLNLNVFLQIVQKAEAERGIAPA